MGFASGQKSGGWLVGFGHGSIVVLGAGLVSVFWYISFIFKLLALLWVFGAEKMGGPITGEAVGG